MDTKSREKFVDLNSSYYRRDGILLVYSITERDSFNNVPKWIENIERYKSESAVYIIVATKCDLEDQRKVSQIEGEELAKKKGVLFFETSSKEGTNVDLAFQSLIRQIILKRNPYEEEGGEKEVRKEEKKGIFSKLFKKS
eukprot:TRINITY_DN8060_c0_g1_i1.p1 TRINITY_DN8060_c0_g1~~TRINITY_DN8060_c0_g1_i1.p1  ORF type:complete len:140 (-),score=50.14 TRINITY_DN8060_c0_g1_i1:325-744(-)